MGLFDGLIDANGTVRIERRVTARDASGGNTETWMTVESNVPVLVSGISGTRDQRFDGKNNILKGRCTGESSNLGLQNIRLYFQTGQFAGLYGHSDSLDQHGPQVDQLLSEPWYSVTFSIYQSGGS